MAARSKGLTGPRFRKMLKQSKSDSAFGSDSFLEDEEDGDESQVVEKPSEAIVTGMSRAFYTTKHLFDILRGKYLLSHVGDIHLRYEWSARILTNEDVRKVRDQLFIKTLGWSLLQETKETKNISATYKKGPAFLYIELTESELRLNLAAPQRKYEKLLTSINTEIEKYRAGTDMKEGDVSVSFVFQGERGPSNNTSTIACPSWATLRENYTHSVREPIDLLMGLQAPWEAGRLLILNGPPGTGKTYFIRSLIREWRKNFCPLLVTDPEVLLSRPNYYYSLPDLREYEFWDGEKDVDEERMPKRMLIIIEDGASVLLKESRDGAGASMARLLNMTDGLIGQSREDIFVISFNEDVTDIDSAFLRPGRCLGNIYFGPLERDEIQEWCTKMEVDYDAVVANCGRREMTLAELYRARQELTGKTLSLLPTSSKRTVGFGK